LSIVWRRLVQELPEADAAGSFFRGDVMTNHFDRRRFIATTLAAGGALCLSRPLMAQSTSTIGVLIPGSINDKGFMESAYDGYKSFEAEHKGKVRTSLIENINYADMEQVFVTLASRNQFVAAVSGASQ